MSTFHFLRLSSIILGIDVKLTLTELSQNIHECADWLGSILRTKAKPLNSFWFPQGKGKFKRDLTDSKYKVIVGKACDCNFLVIEIKKNNNKYSKQKIHAPRSFSKVLSLYYSLLYTKNVDYNFQITRNMVHIYLL